MKPELDDVNFMEGMKALLDFDEEQIEALLDKLDSNSLLALADAVAHKDKAAADDIIGSFEGQLNSLFRTVDDEAEEKNEEKKHPVKPPKDYRYSIGDDVAIKTTNEDDGKEEFVSATVFKPEGPSNTVGLKIKGKPKMVDRDEVYVLKEMGVMGMVAMPDIQRMKQLAGIQSVTTEPVQEPDDQPPMNISTMEDQMGVVSQAISALDSFEQALPNIRLADLKTIRQRMFDIQAKMNESILSTQPTGRPKKL